MDPRDFGSLKNAICRCKYTKTAYPCSYCKAQDLKKSRLKERLKARQSRLKESINVE